MRMIDNNLWRLHFKREPFCHTQTYWLLEHWIIPWSRSKESLPNIIEIMWSNHVKSVKSIEIPDIFA